MRPAAARALAVLRGAAAFALALLLTLLAAPAGAEGARVARAQLRGGERAGLVFFLPAGGEAGAAAVGAAHSFDGTRLAEAGEVEFAVPAAGGPVARSLRYLARPGRAFHAPGSSYAEDFVAFALEAPPRGVRVLEPAPGVPAPGTRVALVGLREGRGGGEVEIPGRVTASSPVVIEVEVDARADLRGLGGAPVVLSDGGQVVGLLQAAWPAGWHTRASVGPVAGAVAALAEPYEGGLGRLFAALAPPASAANAPDARRRAAAGTPLGDLSPDAVARRLDEALPSEPLALAAGLRLEVALPEPEAVLGDAAGAFVSGRALAQAPASGRLDVFLAIDTSESAGSPSGVDVDGDGEVGAEASRAYPSSTDPGDSVLAAEVAAAGRVVDGLDPARTRVGLVTFAGEALIGRLRDLDRPPVRRAALVLEPLTSDYRRIRSALYDLSRSEPYGMTHMAAGIDLATLELLGLAGSVGGADAESAKAILFFTDGQPTLPYLTSERGNVGAVRLAADRARRAGVRIHSFAIGPEALEGPVAAVEMAAISEGLFTAVPDPGRLSEFVEATALAGVQAVAVRNASSGARAHELSLHADGSFEALVPLEVGKNLLEVSARSSRGEEARTEVLVHYAPGSARVALPAELLGRYNALLQRRLLSLGADQREQIRRELVLEIDRERSRALERASAQRKELELRAAGPGELQGSASRGERAPAD